MELSRRDFLKLSGTASAGGLLIYKALDAEPVSAGSLQLDLSKPIGEVPTICCYCGVGCGAIVAADADRVINIEGDPDHPINQGTLCPKGQALSQIHEINGEINRQRLTKPLYRAPNATEWEERSWEEMIEMVAERVKGTRDQYFVTQAQNASGATVTVNRCESIGQMGGGELDNEECYLAAKMARALGLVFLEHCARL
jgi:formate dehydrogenase major subunit